MKEAGTYVVSCKLPGSAAENLWISGATVVEDEITVVDLDLSSGGAVVGTVRNADGEPTPGAFVFVRPENRETTHTDAHAETEVDGSYQTGGLEGGAYVVSFKLPGSAVENLWISGVTVVEGETTVVDIGAKHSVLINVHPNERAPGASSNQYIGVQPWTQPMAGPPQGSYWWKKYAFAAHGPLWVQACAQNWDKNQKGYLDHDDTKLTVNGVTVVDYDGLQSGAPGTWQWTGGAESGQRVTLRFLVPVTPGKQDLWLGADESPALWWLKVIDLEPGVIEAF